MTEPPKIENIEIDKMTPEQKRIKESTPKDISYEIITEHELVKKYELPDSVLSILGESEAVIFSVVDDILSHALHSHTLEKIFKIEDLKKLKPVRAKKE